MVILCLHFWQTPMASLFLVLVPCPTYTHSQFHNVYIYIYTHIYIATNILHVYHLFMNASTLRNRFKSIRFSFLLFIAAAS